MPAAPAGLRVRFEQTAGPRAIDTERLARLLLLLEPKSRTAFASATSAYRLFAACYNEGRDADGWPLLAEVRWNLLRVQQSDDWQLREKVDRGGMLHAALDLEQRLLDRFAAAVTAV